MSYEVRFFEAKRLPRSFIDQTLDENTWTEMCQGNLAFEDYAENAVRSAEKIGIVLSRRRDPLLGIKKVFIGKHTVTF